MSALRCWPLWAVMAGAAAAAAAAPRDLRSSAGVCADIGLPVCPQPFDSALPRAAEMLTWDRPTRVIGFRNTYRLYPGDVFHTLGGDPYPLPAAPRALPAVHYLMSGHTQGVGDYLERQHVTGLLILKDGHVVYEYYGAGNTDRTLWTSRSVAKSVVSILIGMAIKEGLIQSVNDPVTRYLPELTGSAWDGVTLKNLLQHTSGVAWNEAYAAADSDFSKLTQCEASSAAYPCVLQLVTSRPRLDGVRPGQVWSYNTGGAWLAGRLLERASGMTIAHYLETHLWSRFAMQSDGVWEALIRDQVDMGGHGFNATLRDWGRFALFVAGGGKLPSGEELLPPDWIAQSIDWTRAAHSVTPATPAGQFGYQWWFNGGAPSRNGRATETSKSAFWAEGIYGQAIAIDRVERLVLVQWSTWQAAETPDALYDEQAVFFDAVAAALRPRVRSAKR